MNKLRTTVCLTLVLAAGFAACKKSGGQVIARAGSVRITQDDFAKELAGSPPMYLNYLSTLEGKKQFLDILLKEKLLVSAAEKSGLTNKKDFQKNIKDYEAQMKEQMADYRKNLLLREYLRELKDGELKIADAEIGEYYEQNRDNYQKPVKVMASHILCTTDEEAQTALARLKKGDAFGAVAKEMSKDPTAERGGLIGEVTLGDLADLPEFEKELFALKTGQLSGVVKTRIGYHVIKKIAETKLPARSKEDATPEIRRVLEKRKFDQWIEAAKKKQNLKIDEKVLAAVPLPQAGGQDMQAMEAGRSAQ